MNKLCSSEKKSNFARRLLFSSFIILSLSTSKVVYSQQPADPDNQNSKVESYNLKELALLKSCGNLTTMFHFQ